MCSAPRLGNGIVLPLCSSSFQRIGDARSYDWKLMPPGSFTNQWNQNPPRPESLFKRRNELVSYKTVSSQSHNRAVSEQTPLSCFIIPQPTSSVSCYSFKDKVSTGHKDMSQKEPRGRLSSTTCCHVVFATGKTWRIDPRTHCRRFRFRAA